MSDWDASSADEAPSTKATPSKSATTSTSTSTTTTAIPPRRSKFDDEDVEDEIADDWDVSEDESPSKKPSGPAALAPAKKKKSLKQKLAEKEAEERRRRELGLDALEAEQDALEPIDPRERKRLQQEAELQADLDSAANLLGTTGIDGAGAAASSSSSSAQRSTARNAAGTASPAPTSLPTPKTKEGWDSLAQQIFNLYIKPHTSTGPNSTPDPLYAKNFVPALTKILCEPTRDVEMRKLSTSVKGWADEKTRYEAQMKKAGGKINAVAGGAAAGVGGGPGGAKPKTVGTASAKNGYDLQAYGEEALDDGDDLDFM